MGSHTGFDPDAQNPVWIDDLVAVGEGIPSIA